MQSVTSTTHSGNDTTAAPESTKQRRAPWSHWQPSYSARAPAPADVEETDDAFDEAHRCVLLQLAEARAVMERMFGYWMDRDEVIPSDEEVCALLGRHTYALHQAVEHLECMRVEHEDECERIARKNGGAT